MFYRCDPGLAPEGRMRAVCTRNGWNPNPADLCCTQSRYKYLYLVLSILSLLWSLSAYLAHCYYSSYEWYGFSCCSPTTGDVMCSYSISIAVTAVVSCTVSLIIDGWWCGTLLYCEEEMWSPEVLLSDNSLQGAEATASTSVWWHCWIVPEHWTEGECHLWSCILQQ